MKISKPPPPKIVRLLARQARAASLGNHSSKSASGASYTVFGPFKAQWDFTLEFDNGERYQIGLVTNDPPGIEWFQNDFNKRGERYTKIRQLKPD